MADEKPKWCLHLKGRAISICCGKPRTHPDTDFCSGCHDHAGFEWICDECDGRWPDGETHELPDPEPPESPEVFRADN